MTDVTIDISMEPPTIGDVPIARDNSDLPKGRRRDGWLPDAQPRFGTVLVDRWHEEGIERDKHFRDGQTAKFFHSQAAACARAVAYSALGLPQSNPMDAPGHFVTNLGRIIHEALQEIIGDVYPGAEVEVHVGEDPFGGHADIKITLHYDLSDGASVDKIICVEIKSLGGYAYQLAVGQKGPAQGPKHDHRVQVALNAKGMDADEAVLVYLSRDAISIPAAKRSGIDEMTRVVAEWTLTREQCEPLANLEIERIVGILALVDEGTLPARKIPDPELPAGHIITDPMTGTWELSDPDGSPRRRTTTWQCDYCPWQDTCAKTGPGREPVSVLVDLGVLAPSTTGNHQQRQTLSGSPEQALSREHGEPRQTGPVGMISPPESEPLPAPTPEP